ncbi:MAG: AsmA-like C-terminal region-containing protein [Verrucomicrobia bacterium]|nr:AsmA-like C-terminal region-containing protein [Verrucomicrobiota bacterium]
MNPRVPMKVSRARRAVRWCRVFVLFALMFLCGGTLYLNQIGIPEVLRSRLELALARQGLNVRLGRVRLNGVRTWVTEDLQFRWNGNLSRFTVREAEFRLAFASLLRLRAEPLSFGILGGALSVAVPGDDERAIEVGDIHAGVRFLPGNRWDLQEFGAVVLGIPTSITGTIENANALSGWSGTGGEAAAGSDVWSKARAWVEWVQHAGFSEDSRLAIQFAADAHDFGKTEGSLQLSSPRAAGTWGAMSDLTVGVRLQPGVTNVAMARLTVDLACRDAVASGTRCDGVAMRGDLTWDVAANVLNRCDWVMDGEEVFGGGIRLLGVKLSGTTSRSSNELFRAVTHLNLGVQSVKGSDGIQAEGSQVAFDAEVFHSRSNPPAVSGDWRLRILEMRAGMVRSGALALRGKVQWPVIDESAGISDLSGDSFFRHLGFDWTGAFETVATPVLSLGAIECSGAWGTAGLNCGLTYREDSGAALRVEGRLDPETRQVEVEIESGVALNRALVWMPPETRDWLDRFTTETPPSLGVTARFTLPAEPGDSAGAELLRSLSLRGRFAIGAGSFGGVAFAECNSEVLYEEGVLRLPNLAISQGVSGSRFDGSINLQTGDFSVSVDGRFDPESLTPALGEAGKDALAIFQFSRPILLVGEVHGRGPDLKELRAEVRVSAEKFLFRDANCDSVSALVSFDGSVIRAVEVAAARGDERFSADLVVFDPKARTIDVTNGISTLDKEVLAHWIGPSVQKQLEPYQFAAPPKVIANGRFPAGDERVADAEFKVSGRAFNYWRLNFEDVSAELRWKAKSLSITNMVASFYGGNLDWRGSFDFSVRDGANFEFLGRFADVDFHRLMTDLMLTNSPLEGVLNGKLAITSANSDDWGSWNGFGDGTIRDGALWDIPIVGVFSPFLNKVVPGLGSSRASAATATFRITDSIIRTSDLAVRSPAVRLRYTGQVDFDGVVEAEMKAEILRDVWAVGRMVTMAFWPLTKAFEFRVTGTLNDPRSMPHFVPQVLLLPFQPIKTIKEVLSPAPPPTVLTPLPDPR